MAQRKKILFLCNAVTLAHPARCLTLAKGLHPDQYEVILYMGHHYDTLLGEIPLRRHDLASTTPQEFARRLAEGKPLFDSQTVNSQLADDFAILEREKPDLVVGDMRITLQISARKAGVPYINLTNGYWSPYAKGRYPMPDLPVTRILGQTLAGTVLNLAHPLFFLPHTAAINQARRLHGLPGFGGSLKHVYTDADFVAYCDLESLLPLPGKPDNHIHIGPVLWAPENIPLPEWWDSIPTGRPVIYVNLGSSGNSLLLPQILQALSKVDASIIAGGADLKGNFSDNMFLAKWLPGDKLCEKASVVISNGGAPSTMQALAGGAYSIGLCNNMDQLMNMKYLEEAGIGSVCGTRPRDIMHLPDMLRTIAERDRSQIEKFKKEISATNAVKNISCAINKILSR